MAYSLLEEDNHTQGGLVACQAQVRPQAGLDTRHRVRRAVEGSMDPVAVHPERNQLEGGFVASMAAVRKDLVRRRLALPALDLPNF